MKKFKYKFQRLLDIRTYQEREQQFKFAEVYSEYLKTENIINDSKNLKYDYFKNSSDYINNLDIDSLILRDKAIIGLKHKIQINNIKLQEQKYLVEKEREVLIDKSKKKKTLEILKEKKFDEFKKEAEKIESNELDEIGQNIYLKNIKNK